MGEGFGIYDLGNDEYLAKYITSANVACGFHAGDPSTMSKTVDLLKANHVAIGAHPGNPDLLGFGRRIMKISAEDAKNYVIYQVGALKAFVEAAGLKLHHIKPHGALLTYSKFDDDVASAILEGVKCIDSNIYIYCPGPSSYFKYEKHAKKLGLRLVSEFYADLDYAPDGQLVVSQLAFKGQKEFDIGYRVQRVLCFMKSGRVTRTDGSEMEFEAESICVHGDRNYSAELVKRLNDAIRKQGIEISPIN
jgi:UPF0271 protein